MNQKRRFWILVIIVSISGFSQGMLLPLISAIFEKDGVSSTLNGLNATALYIGTLIVSPFMELLLRRFGYKPLILYGGALVFVSLMAFPLWKSVVFWFVLRLLIGIGDHALHFATQTWITSFSSMNRLGKNIAIYGLSFGVGFAVGPQFVPLMNIYEGLPFIVSSLLCLFAWSFVFFLKNEFPENVQMKGEDVGFWKRVTLTSSVAWAAFLGPFGFGFLESSLNAMYPVYALRNGANLVLISQTLTAFALGGILTQLPLGMLSDKIGRRAVVLLAFGGGTVFFFIATLIPVASWWVVFAVFCAGMFIGSAFSLGISYMSELVPKQLLPMGNLLCGFFFSIGSLSGPIVGGYVMEHTVMNYLMILVILLAFITVVLLFSPLFMKKKEALD